MPNARDGRWRVLSSAVATIIFFVVESDAAAFAHRAALKAAVTSCLAYKSTGNACCGIAYDSDCGDPANARCGAAGCDEMANWNTTSVTTMVQMFRYAGSFNGDLSGWDTSSVTNMDWMFRDAGSFNGDISGWDTSSVTNMRAMFRGAGSFNGDLSGWDTSSVTNMDWMFRGAGSFNGDISGWDTSSVTIMYQMFYDAGSFNGDISRWDTSSVTNMREMFFQAGSFNGDISGWDTSSVTNMYTNMYAMFYGATAWLASYTDTRNPASSFNDGPPSAWIRTAPWPPPPASPPPPPNPPPESPPLPPLPPPPSPTSSESSPDDDDGEESISTHWIGLAGACAFALAVVLAVKCYRGDAYPGDCSCFWGDPTWDRTRRSSKVTPTGPEGDGDGSRGTTRAATIGDGLVDAMMKGLGDVSGARLKLEKWVPTKRWGA